MKTNEIGLREARTKIGEIANRADLTGEITYITRNGRAIAAIVPVTIAQEAGMLTIASTVARADVAEDVADEIREAVDSGTLVRESFSRDEIGQKEYWIRVVEFKLRGATKWAIDHTDPAEAELHVWDEQDQAERTYEQRVRDLSEISGWRWDESDVEGAALRGDADDED